MTKWNYKFHWAFDVNIYFLRHEIIFSYITIQLKVKYCHGNVNPKFHIETFHIIGKKCMLYILVKKLFGKKSLRNSEFSNETDCFNFDSIKSLEV
jgi:hypothetical protein